MGKYIKKHVIDKHVKIVSSNPIKRWKAPLTKLAKRILQASITIGAIGGSVIAADYTGIKVPEIYFTIASYMALVGIVGAAISKSTFDKKEVERQIIRELKQKGRE